MVKWGALNICSQWEFGMGGGGVCVNPASCPKDELNIFHLDHWMMCLDRAGSRMIPHFPDSGSFCFALFFSLSVSNSYSFTTMAQLHQEKRLIHLSLFHSLSNTTVCEEWSSSPPVPSIFSQWHLNTNVLVVLGRWAGSRTWYDQGVTPV